MDLAAEDFSRAIECAPNMADAYLDRGTVRCAKATDSHNFIKTILAGKATDEAQRILLMAQLEHIGGHDYVPQFDALLRGFRSNRDEAESLMAKSLVLFVHNDAREAVEDLSRAITLDPDSAEAFY
jgi:Tfp pilus assembly protein PilF